MPDTGIPYIAILRGINVSGKNVIRMDHLRSLFVSLGFRNVSTYIQSGNVLFLAASADEQQLTETIYQAIRNEFGFDVPVIIRNQPELMTIINGNPFLAEKNIPHDKLHVTFLSGIPAEEALKSLVAPASGDDQYIVHGREIYLYCPGGYGNTKLSNTFFEKKLKVTATTRNWNTVNKLADLTGSL